MRQHPEVKVVVLHAGMNTGTRAGLIRSFNGIKLGGTDLAPHYEHKLAGEAIVLIGNTALFSSGYCLERANNICLFDLPWNSAVLEQAIGRIYRSGQTQKTYARILISLGNSIERKLHQSMKLLDSVNDISFTVTNGEAEARQQQEKVEADRQRRDQLRQLRHDQDLYMA